MGDSELSSGRNAGRISGLKVSVSTLFLARRIDHISSSIEPFQLGQGDLSAAFFSRCNELKILRSAPSGVKVLHGGRTLYILQDDGLWYE
jgi:hypothetical protein